MNLMNRKWTWMVFVFCLGPSVLDCYTPLSRPRPLGDEPALIISGRRSIAVRRRLLKAVGIKHCVPIAEIDNDSFFDYPDWHTSEVILSNMALGKGADTIVVNSFNYLTFSMQGKAYRCGETRRPMRFTPPGEDLMPVPIASSSGKDCVAPAEATYDYRKQYCYEDDDDVRRTQCARKVQEMICRRINRDQECSRLCAAQRL